MKFLCCDAAPLTGLIVQPIIGYLSDRTWHLVGRRRPYFLIGAILSSIAFFFVPHSPYLWVAVGFLWILDASQYQYGAICALVADKLPDQRSWFCDPNFGLVVSELGLPVTFLGCVTTRCSDAGTLYSTYVC